MTKNKTAKYVLIAGCQRTGTTILAACLGRHPDINMMIESTTEDVLKGIGKEYNGNKLCLYSQVRYSTRASRFGHLINRIYNPLSGYMKRRPFPTSKMSIEDYIDNNAKIIFVVRNEEDTVASMMKRAGMSERLALKQYHESVSIMNLVLKYRHVGMIVHYEKFLEDNESVLRRVCDYLGLPFDDRMLEGQKYNFIYNEYERKS